MLCSNLFSKASVVSFETNWRPNLYSSFGMLLTCRCSVWQNWTRSSKFIAFMFFMTVWSRRLSKSYLLVSSVSESICVLSLNEDAVMLRIWLFTTVESEWCPFSLDILELPTVLNLACLGCGMTWSEYNGDAFSKLFYQSSIADIASSCSMGLVSRWRMAWISVTALLRVCRVSNLLKSLADYS